MQLHPTGSPDRRDDAVPSTTVHWSIYLAAIIALLIGLAFLARHYVEGKANLLLLLGSYSWFGVTGIIVAVAAGLTDRRYKTGLVGRHTVEMNLDKVESVDAEPVHHRAAVRLWDGYDPRHRCGGSAVAGHR